jgi:type II secretory pathway pseudopilin PulG
MIMKANSRQFVKVTNQRLMTGVTLLEVLLAIAVFAFGMLALVQLQGNLTRSSADANTRTVAGAIAEELAEDIRGYQQVEALAGNPIDGLGQWEYLELFGTELNHTATRGNLDYDVSVTISDFWYDPAADSFVETEAVDPPATPDGLSQAYADFKLLRINVAWGDAPEFYVDDETTAQLGPGSITIHEIIPNSPPILGAKIAADLNAPAGGPVVEHTPGEVPEIVALRFNENRLKESTTPVPTIIRSGELSETYFEVISYNNANTFLRREEFLAVGCECTLNPRRNAPEFGRRPTVWNGVEYTLGEQVFDKDVGASANNQQSVFCDVCCRDHHDGGTAAGDAAYADDRRLVFDPWNYSVDNKGVNHPHYGRNNQGNVYEAGDGDTYLEACRMIRSDGFFRVAQDFDQQAFLAFPDDYLDNIAEVGEYSGYVTDAVSDFYTTGQGDLMQPGDDGVARFTNPVDGLMYAFPPASLDPDPATDGRAGPATRLPTALGFENQQLRSRGIYVDYMTKELSDKIAGCPGVTCQIPDFETPLEVYPFFEVQVTNLSNWTEDPLNVPMDVTNEAIASGNGYSRGRADLKAKGMGRTKADFAIHKGNVGFAATDPIRPNDPKAADEGIDLLWVDTTDEGLPPVSGFEITGQITSGVGGVKAVDAVISFSEAECGRSPTGYKCIVPTLATGPTMTISNYYKANQPLYACSAALTIKSSTSGSDNSTTFYLPKASLSLADINIQNTPCP